MPPPRPPVASPPPPPPLPPGGARATPYAPPNDIVPREAQAAEHGGLLGRSGAVDGAEAEAGGRTQARGEEGFARGKRARMDGEGREDGGARQGAQDLPRAGTGGGGGTVFLAPSLIRLSTCSGVPCSSWFGRNGADCRQGWGHEVSREGVALRRVHPHDNLDARREY